MKITESQLRQIVRNEARRLAEMGNPNDGDFSYSSKSQRLQEALSILESVQENETSMVGEPDPDLSSIIEALDGYIGAVQIMADQESSVPLR